MRACSDGCGVMVTDIIPVLGYHTSEKPRLLKEAAVLLVNRMQGLE